MRLATRLSSWVVLLSATSLGAAVQDDGAKPAVKSEVTPGAASTGFDVERPGIERGHVETVEYDSKTVGTHTQDDRLHAAGLHERHQISSPVPAARHRRRRERMDREGVGRTSSSTTSTPTRSSCR